MADDGGEKHENDEIVELQRAAEGRKAESSVVLPVQGPAAAGVVVGDISLLLFLIHMLLMGMRQAMRDFKPYQLLIAQEF
ncbi:hypothetical protein [Rhizobium sp. AN83]|uniref:hypothetical protein n=1 Tax=Rhizobium sp. AN83 TaxID=3035217 RepID=UPI002B263ECD|nr:hypothetical protein [Rhizobium sp. AN83]